MRIGVLGLGTMGCGIGETALRAGLELRAADADEATTAAGLERLRARIDRHVAGGLVGPELAGLAGGVEAATLEECCDGADVIIEAVPEDRALKQEVLAAAFAVNPGALLATNSSSFPPDSLADALPDASRFLGMHFFNPAEWIPGVEVVQGAATGTEALGEALELLSRLGKTPAVVRSSPGFIANRLQMALFLECVRCVEEGLAGREAVDAIVKSTFGFRLGAFGPFRIADMAGLDVYTSILETLQEAFGERFATPMLVRQLVEAGSLGLKAGEGFASYPPHVAADLQERRDAVYEQLLRSAPLPSEHAGQVGGGAAG